MSIEDMNMSASTNDNSDVKIEKNHQQMPHQQTKCLIKENHLECHKCDKRFVNSYNLEENLVSIHNETKSFNCDKCENKFVTKWRLKRHQECHNEKTQRKCHYFNNMIECPFQEYGCKFLHIESEVCKFGKNFRRTMCQFRH